ncbi:MAG: alkaline phosphatase family protein [Nocardioidaceae bacterium]|nr:alkaline phosphatase family protein [Nocardioidaceae bacterium]
MTRVPADALILGPLLRYVDETSAAIWVETRDTTQVTVRAGGRQWTADTFNVHGHHYALVQVDGLEPGTVVDYAVDVAGVEEWPPEGSSFPPSRIATLEPGRQLRMAFGSCRTSVPHDSKGNRIHGVDAMRAYALHMAENTEEWPDLIVFLGDQVYADLTSDAMQDFISSRRNLNEEPGEELKDYEEYCHLYKLAWSDPANRWLLSTLPSSMIFDDHDIRDDWNTSLAWRHEMEATSWWGERIVAGLASYWVYQHLGNMSPADRATDEVWQQILAGQESAAASDLGDVLDELAARVDAQPESYRWSHARQIGHCRLIVIDSRAARILQDDKRSILDDDEMHWLDEQLHGDVDHVFIGTSLPYLLSPGLHQLEAWSEAVAAGAWGRRLKGFGEKVRRTIDMEHWAAFQDGFREVADMVCELADGKRGVAPATVTFLSGDVHNSYVCEVDRGLAVDVQGSSRILQAVCSPIRNPLPRVVRQATAIASKSIGSGFANRLARSAKVPDPPFTWETIEGPWFDNNLATLETDGPTLRMRWERGVIEDGKPDSPGIEVVSELVIEPLAMNSRRQANE